MAHHQPQCNTELVADMMDFSRFGPLAQIFIVDAISRAANAAAVARPEDFPAGEMMVSPESWIGVAQEIKGKMDAFYSRHDQPSTIDG